MADFTDEQVCDFYYALSKRIPPHLFACVPHPLLVESDKRLVDLFNKELANTVRTNSIQAEYHNRMMEDAEHAADHVAWYEEQMKFFNMRELPPLEE
jgi:hypothetical protein